MIWKALSVAAWGIAALAAAGSCPDAPRGHAAAAPPPEVESSRSPAPVAPTRTAIEKALAVLQAEGDAWMEGRVPFQDGSGCVSCHQVPYGVWALHEASRAGLAGDPTAVAAAADLTRRATRFIDDTRTGRPMSWSPILLAVAGGEDETRLSGWTDLLLGTQRPAGFWEAKGQFPSQRREVSESNAVATMLAMLALLDREPAAATDAAVAGSLDAAWGWLLERGPGDSTEWLALRALVARARGEADEARGLFDRLVERQNADGGWGWQAGEPSNPMSTGEALWALGRAADGDAGGAADREAAARRGIDHLLAAQDDDGWWRMRSELVTRRPGEGNDYVYAYWGTAWATIGLARWHRAVPAPATIASTPS